MMLSISFLPQLHFLMIIQLDITHQRLVFSIPLHNRYIFITEMVNSFLSLKISPPFTPEILHMQEKTTF